MGEGHDRFSHGQMMTGRPPSLPKLAATFIREAAAFLLQFLSAARLATFRFPWHRRVNWSQTRGLPAMHAGRCPPGRGLRGSGAAMKDPCAGGRRRRGGDAVNAPRIPLLAPLPPRPVIDVIDVIDLLTVVTGQARRPKKPKLGLRGPCVLTHRSLKVGIFGFPDPNLLQAPSYFKNRYS